MKEIYYISGEKETVYGHNDRTKNDYCFAHYDDDGIIDIGEEKTNNQGGFFVQRPYTSEELTNIFKYLLRKDLEFSRKLFLKVNKYHLNEYALAFGISTEELKKNMRV